MERKETEREREREKTQRKTGPAVVGCLDYIIPSVSGVDSLLLLLD
jgi:hypothetical protein